MKYNDQHFSYHHLNHINGDANGAVAFSMKGWLEICEKGWSWNNWLPFNYDDPCCYSMYQNQICGIIVYNISVDKKCSIQLGYVDAKFRGSPVYDTLWDMVKEQAKECTVIESYVHPDNKAMIKKTQKQNRDIAFYVIRSKP